VNKAPVLIPRFSCLLKITGHRTLHIFMRYNIISTGQLHEAMDKVTSKKKAAK